MNQKLILSVLVVVVAVIGIVVFSSDNSQDEAAMMQKDDGAMMEGGEAMMEKEGEAMMEGGEAMMEEGDAMVEHGGDAMMTKSGSYIPYDAAKLAMAADGDVVLFFKASWCPSCKSADNDIRANLSNIPANLTILELDYDKSSDLKKKYGVTSQHTFVQVDAQGNLIKKWLGSPTLAAVVSELK